MRRRPSEVWTELGYFDPALANAELAQARQRDRQEYRERKEAAASVPVRRADARSAFAHMHAVVDGGGEC